MQVAGFQLQDVIHAGGDTVVARALSPAGEAVVLKLLDSQQPAPEQVARWRHEFALLRGFDSEWIIQARELLALERSLVLVLEPFGSHSLAQLIERQLLDLPERLNLALQLTQALAAVHGRQLVHGDVAPKNVLVDLAQMRLKLCDFGLATRLDQPPGIGLQLRGTLDYLAPEQTGRTNLAVDHRSDLYALGVTLYELFGGRRPFQASDPLSLLHAQLAQAPRPLQELGVPEALAAIVHKLLAKQPDQRYQSSHGLLHDLQQCADALRQQGRVEPFALARHDVPERFQLAQKLYGRAAETAAILAAFERVQGGRPELLLVSGPSGIGKTALVAELHRPILARRGHFLRGKCEQYARNQPYAALLQAFQPLLLQLAAEQPLYWQERLREALGEQAAALLALLPALAPLLGEVPPLQALPPAEQEQRLHYVFGRFVQALAAPAHPLLLFIDDLQWADAPTLGLLDSLLRAEEGGCLLVVGAYRDNEVDERHPLQDLQAGLRQAGVAVERLQLRNLQLDEIAELLGDSLACPAAQTLELARLCLDKTAGNPFFLGQFLRRLAEQGDLRYEHAAGAWRWRLDVIAGRGMTDNVVELMLQRLRELAPPTQQLLARAAFLGEAFSLRELMLLSAQDAAACAAQLWPALSAGLLQPLDEGYQFDSDPQLLARARFRFLHDRVQQAAHGLTPETARCALQLEGGRRLLAGLAEAELEERLFVVLDGLNQGLALIADPAERAMLRALNLRAGLRAKTASAYPAAVRCLRQARALVAPDGWLSEPAQTHAIHKALAEAEYLSGDFAAAEALYPEVQSRCPDPLHRAELCLVQADQFNIQGRFAEAVPVLIQGLALVGHPFPVEDAEAMAAFPAEFATCQALLAAQGGFEAHAQAAEMRDPARLLQMQLNLALSHASYQLAQFGLFLLNACRMLRTVVEQGQCDLSSIAFVAYTTAMSAMKRPYPDVFAMGRFALRLAEARDNQHYRITVYQYHCPFYQHWGESLHQTLAPLERAIALGQSGMNPLSTGYCVLLRAVNLAILGEPLDALQTEAERALRFLQRSHQVNTEAMLRHGVLQPLAALRGQTEGPLSFDGPELRSSDYFGGDLRSPGIPLAFYSVAWLRHALLFDAAEAWRLHAPNVPMIGQVLPDSPSWVEACFYLALGLLRDGFAETPEAERLAQAEAERTRFALWAEGCEANFRHRELLIAAELARVRGDERAAMNLYAQAIAAAGEAGFLVDEALANELYARFWWSLQQRQLALNFIREAYYLYRRWGALAKCRQLEAAWPQALFRVAGPRESLASRSRSEQAELLDLQSLIKANQTLSQQIQLDTLLERMLALMLENAGAERGAIVVADEHEGLRLETLGALAPGGALQCQRLSLPLAEAGALLPLALLEAVRQSRQSLVLGPRDERYAQQPYLLGQAPKSVLCLPVLNQGQLVALVYLENRLLEEAFTLRHLQTLQVLGAQAAISLVNARLVETLEQKVAARTEALRQMTMKDGLTGIANRRAFDERLELEWRRSRRQQQPLALLMVDIDHFKPYNDRYGHLEGDRCIQLVAQTLAQAATRAGDLVARYGGEEFVLLLPQTDLAAALGMAQACAEALRKQGIVHQASPVAAQVSLSIGVAVLEADEQAPAETLIARADAALYRAKRAGRDRIAS